MKLPFFNKLLSLDVIENFLIFAFLMILPSQFRHTYFNFSNLNGVFNEFYSISIYASDLAFAALLIFELIILERGGRKVPELLQIFVSFMLIFLGFTFFFVRANELPRETYIHLSFTLFTWAKLGTICILFKMLFEQKSKIIFESIVAAGLVQAVVGLFQFIKQRSIGLHFLGEQVLNRTLAGVAKIDVGNQKLIRGYGLFAHPNQLAAFLVVACATALFALSKEEDQTERIFITIIFWILVIGEVITFSRAGIVALLITTALQLFFSKRYNPGPFLNKTAIAAIISIISAFIIFAPYLSSRVKIIDQSNISRAAYDKTGLDIIRANLLGVGPGQLIVAVSENLGNVQNWQIQPPHNYFLDVACETGILGVIAIIYLFWILASRLFKKIVRRLPDQTVMSHNILLFSIFIGFIFLMQFDHYFYTLQQTQLLLWILIGMIIAATEAEQGPMVQW